MDEDPGHFGRGIVVGMVLTALGGLSCAVSGIFPVTAVGLFQILWMGPAFCIYLGRGKTQTAGGIVLVASLIFMLTVGVLCGVVRRGGI